MDIPVNSPRPPPTDDDQWNISNSHRTATNNLNHLVRIAVENPMRTLQMTHTYFVERQGKEEKGRRMMSPTLRLREDKGDWEKWRKIEVNGQAEKGEEEEGRRKGVVAGEGVKGKVVGRVGGLQNKGGIDDRSKSPVTSVQNTLAKYRSLKDLIKPPSPLLYTPHLPKLSPIPPHLPCKPPTNSTVDSCHHPKPRQISIYTLKDTVSTLSIDQSQKNHSRSPTATTAQLAQLALAAIPVIPPPPPSIHDWEIVKEIGRGRFSKVYMIRHKNTGFIAALKLMSKKSLQSERITQQIQRQIKIHQTLRHPHLIQFYACYQDHINIYLIFQLGCDGQLYQKLTQKRRFCQQTTSFIIRNVLQAVAHLHHKKILHRDIKPQNIVLVHGIAKLCDLGWSVNHNPDSLRQTVCGTPLYASPELIRGDSYNEKNDLWAVGVLAYELVYGEIPFRIRRGEELLKIVTEEIEFPKDIQVSGSFRDFIMTTLSKNPFKRLDCDEMLRHPFITKYRDIEVCSDLLT